MGGPHGGFHGFQGANPGGFNEIDTKITLNLEDVVLHEQKLYSIHEVSMNRIYHTTALFCINP